MKTSKEVLELLATRIDRPTLEKYILRQWVRPGRKQEDWDFEDIDIARLELICQLRQDIEVNEEGVEVVLSLLDQLYDARSQMRKLIYAINQQPYEIQIDLMAILKH